MRKSVPAADPDAYVYALGGWRRTCVEMLRSAVLKVARLKEKSSGLRGQRSGAADPRGG